MDVARFRSAAPRLTPVKGFTRHILLRPLTRAELFYVEDQTEQLFGNHRHAARDRHEQLEVVKLAAGIDVADLAPRIVGYLCEAWGVIQDEHMPPGELLGYEAQLQLIEERGSLVGEANAAGHSSSPGDFYGCAVAELTDGQLAYYLALRSAHEKWSEKKCRTVAFLKQATGRSATTSPRNGAR